MKVRVWAKIQYSQGFVVEVENEDAPLEVIKDNAIEVVNKFLSVPTFLLPKEIVGIATEKQDAPMPTDTWIAYPLKKER